MTFITVTSANGDPVLINLELVRSITVVLRENYDTLEFERAPGACIVFADGSHQLVKDNFDELAMVFDDDSGEHVTRWIRNYRPVR